MKEAPNIKKAIKTEVVKGFTKPTADVEKKEAIGIGVEKNEGKQAPKAEAKNPDKKIEDQAEDEVDIKITGPQKIKPAEKQKDLKVGSASKAKPKKEAVAEKADSNNS